MIYFKNGRSVNVDMWQNKNGRSIENGRTRLKMNGRESRLEIVNEHPTHNLDFHILGPMDYMVLISPAALVVVVLFV